MIAIAIASIALVSFISLVITSIDMEYHARKITEATFAADDKLKEIERLGYPEVGQTEGPIYGQQPGGPATTAGPLQPAGTVSAQVPTEFTYRAVVTETPIQGVREVDVDIYWDKKRRSVTLTTFIAKQQ
jgi:hypothetical protein